MVPLSSLKISFPNISRSMKACDHERDVPVQTLIFCCCVLEETLADPNQPLEMPVRAQVIFKLKREFLPPQALPKPRKP